MNEVKVLPKRVYDSLPVKIRAIAKLLQEEGMLKIEDEPGKRQIV